MSDTYRGAGLQVPVSLIIQGRKTKALTHRNNICSHAIHAIVILVRPVEPRLDEFLQTLVSFSKLLPCRHEHLKRGNGTTQDQCFLE